MTFKEKLAKELPDRINSYSACGCEGCPEDYKYEEYSDCNMCETCEECWNREIPETIVKEQD